MGDVGVCSLDGLDNVLDCDGDSSLEAVCQEGLAGGEDSIDYDIDVCREVGGVTGLRFPQAPPGTSLPRLPIHHIRQPPRPELLRAGGSAPWRRRRGCRVESADVVLGFGVETEGDAAAVHCAELVGGEQKSQSRLNVPKVNSKIREAEGMFGKEEIESTPRKGACVVMVQMVRSQSGVARDDGEHDLKRR